VYVSPTDTILGAASSLSVGDLRSVIVRMHAMCDGLGIDMSAADPTTADAPQSEPIEEGHPAMTSPADTLLRDASALSDAELRRVVARLNHLMGT
jgi:hypothetical protein